MLCWKIFGIAIFCSVMFFFLIVRNLKARRAKNVDVFFDLTKL
jgi:hypothetical protein